LRRLAFLAVDQRNKSGFRGIVEGSLVPHLHRQVLILNDHGTAFDLARDHNCL
jgi:hypothetical protein